MNGKNLRADCGAPRVSATDIADASAPPAERIWKRTDGRCPPSAAVLVALDVMAVGYAQDVVEIGAVRYENGAEVSMFSSFVNPGRAVPPEELEGSGIRPSMLSGAPGLAEIIPALDAFLKNAVLAAHGDSYSVWLLRKAYETVNDTLVIPTIDALPCARRLFEILRRDYPYPDYLMNDFMTPRAEPYRAVDSARLAGGEFLRAFEELRSPWRFS